MSISTICIKKKTAKEQNVFNKIYDLIDHFKAIGELYPGYRSKSQDNVRIFQTHGTL